MNQGQREWPKFVLRLPPDLRAWVADQSAKHGSSQNSEIIRALREKAERETKAASEGAGTPAEA